MALQERDREDLLRDGRTMVVRGEFVIDNATVLVGFREQGQMSLYVGADPVFQFNSRGQLRRLFFQGRRFAAEEKRLIELIRESRGGNVQLKKNRIDASTLAALTCLAVEWLDKVAQCVHDPSSKWRVVGDDSNSFRQRVAHWLENHAKSVTIAESPNA